MGKGTQVRAGATFFPKKGEEKGVEIRGIYRGFTDGEYQGKPQKIAVFEGLDEVYHIASGSMVKTIAPKLQIDATYYVVFTGKKEMKNGQAANQFDVFESDGKD